MEEIVHCMLKMSFSQISPHATLPWKSSTITVGVGLPQSSIVKEIYCQSPFSLTRLCTPEQVGLSCQCAYGEQLKLVGNKEELGNWDVTSAPTLSWADGDAWTGQVQLGEADEARFKLVLLGHEGVVWEPVSDRYDI